MAIAPGQQTYSMKANWKLLVENSADAYHAPFTHQRFFTQFIQDIGADLKAWAKMAQQTTDNRVIGFPYGHGVMDVPAGPLPMDASDPEEVAKLRAALTAKYGAERTSRMMDRSRNLIIFPNLILISAWRTLRTFYPISPDYMEIDAWALVGRNDSPELREMRYNNFICFLGPAGFGTPDDVEALARCQKGFAATEMAWTDLSKGMARPGGSLANDEFHMRNVWRTWASMLDPNFTPSDEKSNAMASSQPA
jgi:phenylpropionate dioxygenase-like ring-hydroxylating dioxygenase large terminal subunit